MCCVAFKGQITGMNCASGTVQYSGQNGHPLVASDSIVAWVKVKQPSRRFSARDDSEYLLVTKHYPLIHRELG